MKKLQTTNLHNEGEIYLKVIIATGSSDIDSKIKLINHVLVDSVNDLSELIDLLNYVEVDALIVNRLLDSEGNQLIELAKAAQTRNIKIVMLTDKVDDYQERKLISILANLSVYSYFTFEHINERVINDALNNYPDKFEFRILAETIIKEKLVTVTKEKIIERVVNFHNKVITVVGNAELTAELAVIAAKHCNKKVVILDLDFFDSGIAALLRLEESLKNNSKESDFQYLLGNVDKGGVDKDCLERSCIQVKGLNLYTLVTEYRPDNYHNLKNVQIDKLIDFVYRNYDLTLVNVNASVLDEYSVMASQNSDHVILSLNGDRISRKQAENYALYMKSNFSIPLDRFNYIIFDYEETMDAPLGYFRSNIPSNQFLGYISFNRKRHTHRNSKVVYARKIYGWYLDEYLNILSQFNIPSNRGLKDMVSDAKKSIMKFLKFKKRKLLRR